MGCKDLHPPGGTLVCVPSEPPVPPFFAFAECFEAVWGAIYVDAGYSLDRVKVIYARLFPLEGVAATVKGKKEEEAVEVPETII